eukprot:1503780-Alexandrium_andersonii.AAC.1
MSASLVGSEMCIRDSRWLQSKRLRAALNRVGIQQQNTPGKFEQRRSEPVSYTHLTLPTICSV